MKTSLPLFAFLWLATVSPGLAQQPSPALVEATKIANSRKLTLAEKAARLGKMTEKDESRKYALEQWDIHDPATATSAALALFGAADSSRLAKLETGHFLLERSRPQREGFPKAFVTEFARYLIGTILDGGEAEICRWLPENSTTAVGEYAYLASGFGGYEGIDFAPFKDARLVPILIRCLDAPDTIHDESSGAHPSRRGKPTGYNTARQQIPVALAKLGDASAIPALEKVLFHHTDIGHLRMNAAYALARLIDQKEARAALGQQLLAEPELVTCRVSFGKGLIERGDDTGVEFLCGNYEKGPPNLPGFPHALLRDLNQRLDILKGFKSPKVADFIGSALEDEQWRDLVRFKPGSVKEEFYTFAPPLTDSEALERCSPQIIRTYAAMLECVRLNRLQSLSGKLDEIAAQTHSDEIRRMTGECLAAIRLNPPDGQPLPAAPTQ